MLKNQRLPKIQSKVVKLFLIKTIKKFSQNSNSFKFFFNGFNDSSMSREAEILTIKSELTNNSFDISFRFTDL